MSRASIAVVVTVIVLALAAIVGVVAVSLDLVPGASATPEDERLLVIAAAQDASGTAAAPIAFVLAPGGDAAMATTLEPATISGTSVTQVREALPFGGGEAVAGVLAPQTGNADISWVVLQPQTWAAMIDDAGGVAVTLPASFNSYGPDGLVVIGAGEQRLTGEQAIALAGGVDFVGTPEQAEQVLAQLTAGLSAIVSSDGGSVIEQALANGGAQASEPASELPVIGGSR